MHCLWTGNTKVPIELHAQVIVYSWRIILNTMSGCAETKMNYLSDKKTTFAGAVVYENTWLNHTLSLGSTLFSKELRFHLMNHFNTDKNTFFRKKRLFIFQREILQRLKKVFLKKFTKFYLSQGQKPSLAIGKPMIILIVYGFCSTVTSKWCQTQHDISISKQLKYGFEMESSKPKAR